jgi:WhiB family transcriptional regulator, redox-sensing transcriptional regulator
VALAAEPGPDVGLLDLAALVGALRFAGQEWRNSAACRGGSPEWWHPERGRTQWAQVKICGTCPVRAECLQFALDNNELHGVWGGCSAKQRLRARQRGLTAAELLERLR